MKKVVEFSQVSKFYELYNEVSYKEIFFNLFRRDKSKIKKSFTSIEDVSFEIYEGECVGIIGRNGSGKSTTLGLIAGVLKPNIGYVKVNKKVSPLLELGGGFHYDLNAYDNIKLNGVLLGIPLKKVKEKIEEIINFAEIEEFANQPIHTYSSGMLARLGFSIVTQLDPELLLVDEVLAVGDEKFRNKCLNLMKSFKNQGVNIIIVSHNMEDIKSICDRVIWIDQHRIKLDGECKEVLGEYYKFMNG
jgi:lipopolysaccharide transport system ATP-binding protein